MPDSILTASGSSGLLFLHHDPLSGPHESLLHPLDPDQDVVAAGRGALGQSEDFSCGYDSRAPHDAKGRPKTTSSTDISILKRRKECLVVIFKGEEIVKNREECLSQNWFPHLDDVLAAKAAWRRDYNEGRPHTSLGGFASVDYVATLLAEAEIREARSETRGL